MCKFFLSLVKKMPQNLKRKTKRGYTSTDVIMCAVKDVKVNNMSI